jgi:phosphate transport system permease protein
MTVMTRPIDRADSTRDRVRRSLTRSRRDLAGGAFTTVLIGATSLSVVVLVVLLADMVLTGGSVLSERFVDFMNGALRSQPEASGIRQGLVGTFWIGVFVVLVAFPLGIAAAVYLEEYAAHGKLARFIDLNIRNLAGVPSVVYGILGLTIFVKALENVTGAEGSNGRTIVSAGLTLAILVLPIVIITASEAIRAVPTGIREASYGVGATRREVVRDHVLPYAAPGILTGTVLALARALGEAAPLILVGATSGYLTGADQFLDLGALRERFTAMPIVVTTWAGRPGEDWEAVTAAAIVVLLGVVLLANTAAILLRNRYESKRG